MSEETNEKDLAIVETKRIRVALDDVLQVMKNSPRQSAERSNSMTRLKEAIMWLGMDLKALDEPNPYPDSYDPSNTKVAPAADGLKM